MEAYLKFQSKQRYLRICLKRVMTVDLREDVLMEPTLAVEGKSNKRLPLARVVQWLWFFPSVIVDALMSSQLQETIVILIEIVLMEQKPAVMELSMTPTWRSAMTVELLLPITLMLVTLSLVRRSPPLKHPQHPTAGLPPLPQLPWEVAVEILISRHGPEKNLITMENVTW